MFPMEISQALNILKMRYKTLVINKGTKNQEFYGHLESIRGGWGTSQTPINLMNESVTMDDLKDKLPKYRDNVELVTVEVKIIED